MLYHSEIIGHATWAHADLPKAFRPDTIARSFVVRTVADLEKANGAELDYGPRGPQHPANAQLQPAT